MRPLNYRTYCVKCGEFNHTAKNCNNIDETKMMHMLNNHQINMLRTIYGTFPSLCMEFNKNGEYKCKKCNRTFRKYKYYLYHSIVHEHDCEHSKIRFPTSPDVIVLK